MSSFQTVGRIKRIRSYAEAQAQYETTKPIRGSDNLRPIGARRDAAKYYIKEAGSGEYCAYLYNTPVVTFNPDNTIVIQTYGYDTALSMDFIGQVLGIPACRTRGQCVFTIDGMKYITSGRGGKLVLRSDNGKLSVTEQQTHKQYVISRSGANTVRRRYSEFRQYLKGFLSLRTQEYTFNSPYHGVGAEVRELVEVNMGELVDHLGVVTRDDGWGGNQVMNKYIDLRSVHHIMAKRSDFYMPNNHAFDLLIQNGQADESRGANFYKACVMLAAAVTAEQGAHSIPTTRGHIRVTPKSIEACLDGIQFKWFSDEVFVLADVPEGKVPNYRYNSWTEAPRISPVPQTKA